MKILLVFMLLFSFVYADFGDKDRRSFGDNDRHHFRKDLRHLKLTDIQKQEMKVILRNYREVIREFREYKEDFEEEKEELFLEDILNENKIREINQKISEFSTKIEIDFLKNIHDILSQQQKNRFKKYIKDWEIE